MTTSTLWANAKNTVGKCEQQPEQNQHKESTRHHAAVDFNLARTRYGADLDEHSSSEVRGQPHSTCSTAERSKAIRRSRPMLMAWRGRRGDPNDNLHVVNEAKQETEHNQHIQSMRHHAAFELTLASLVKQTTRS